ncbi:MAG: alpha/beta fold hydrolase, partial [Polyangiales bacterium]
MQIAHELFAIRVGVEEGTPLVMVHAGPGESHDVLRPHFDRLGDRRPVIFYDQRGGGRSSSTKIVGWEGHVADLDSLRVALGVDRVDLLGFSWGAMLAALYASEHRAHVSRLVLVSPPGKGEPHARPEVDAFLRELGDDDSPRARFARKVAPWLADPRKALELEPVERAGAAAVAAEASLREIDLRA